MPVIREYNQQTRGLGPVDGPKYSAEMLGGAAGDAMTKLGGAVQDAGELVAKRIDQQNTSDITAKITKANADLAIKLQNTIRTAKPGDTKPFEDYQKEAEETLGKIGEEARTSGARAFYQEASGRIKANLAQTSANGMAELAGIKAITDYRETQNNLTSAAMADPSSVQLQRDMNKATIENLVQSGSLPREKAIELEAQGEAQLSKAALRGWTQLNPDYAKKKLASGEFDSTLGADGKAQMLGEIDQAVRAKEIEAERRMREQERIVKLQQEKTQNSFLQSMVDKNLTAKDILNSNLEAFGSGSKEQFLNMLKVANSPDEKLKDDPATTIALFNRIHLPDGDPNKITNDADLNSYFGNGVSMTTLQKLRDEVQGQNTEQGRIDAEMKRQVFEIAKGKLTRSNPLTGFKDPIGDEQMAKFQAWFLETYRTERANGKTAASLLNPTSPEYLGKQIGSYTRTPQQMLRDMVPKKPTGDGGLAVTPSVPTAGAANSTFIAPPKPKKPSRKPGESAADYISRTKGM